MKSQDNFQIQIKWMKDILVSNTIIAESINQLLKKIDPQVLAQSVDIVYEQCQKKYPWTFLRAQEQTDKLQSIRKALSLVKREQVTNIDELNLKLACEINDYYGHQYIQVKKKLPFYLKCKHCEENVSNYQLGLKNHQLNCRKTTQNIGQQKTNKSKRKRKRSESQYQDSFYQSEEQIAISKNQKLTMKKRQKQHSKYLFSDKKQADDGTKKNQLRKNKSTRKIRHQCIQPVSLSAELKQI